MPTLIQPSFGKGEISPSLYGRVDTAMYGSALRTGRNLIIHPSGGASNRAGTVFVAPVKTHSISPRLVEFQFKTSDQYILEFGNLYMRVYRNGAQVLNTAKNITGATAANPVVITSNAHGFSNGDQVYIASVGGMTRLNGRWFTVANVAANTFELTSQVTGSNINGTGFAAYTSGGTASEVYEITTPYATADLDELKFVQSADVMTITHKTYEPRELSRTGHTAWTLAAPTFEPTIDFPTGQTVTPTAPAAVTVRYRVTAIAEDTFEESLSALNNTVRTITGITQANPAVVTSNGHGFSNGDEVHIYGVAGMTELNHRRFICANVAANTFQLTDENSTAYTAYSSGGSVAQTFVRITNSAATMNNTIAWTASADAFKYAVYKEDNGLFGLIGETELTTFLDDDITVDFDASPPRARNPFLGSGNYPGTASYFEQRRVFGGSTNRPDTSFYSQVGNHSNFTAASPQQQDDAITATLNSRQVNEIRHYVPLNDLLTFTSGSEWRINSGSDAAFAAGTIKQKPQSIWGVSHHRPVVVGNVVIYAEENNASVRSYGFSIQIDGYTGTNLGILADHMLEDATIADWAYAHSPDSIIHAALSDGTAIALTFQQEQEVIAWTTWDTLGKFERVAALRHGETEVDDIVYFVVKRTINGSTVRYIERSHSRRFTDVQDCYFVDCGLSLDSPVAITGATAANPVVITASSHGFSNGDEVDINGIIWEPTFDDVDNETQPDQLNGNRYTVANVAANTFELSGVNGSAFDAYVEAGEVRKAVTAITGADHLEGRAVSVLADGNVISGHTVSNGGITLARKASRVHVGLKYISDLETLNVEAPSGTMQGKLKKIPSVTVRFKKSRGLFIGPTSDNLVEMKQREFEVMGAPTALLTGDKPIKIHPSWNSNGRVFLRQRYPLPMTILAIIPDIFTEDASRNE